MTREPKRNETAPQSTPQTRLIDRLIETAQLAPSADQLPAAINFAGELGADPDSTRQAQHRGHRAAAGHRS